VSDRPGGYNVLFICTENAARSIMAEAAMNSMGEGKFRAFSGGSNPSGTVHPMTINVLNDLRIDTGFARSKSWDEYAGPGAPRMDFVFTVCDAAAGEACPVWPGHPLTGHWGVPDPKRAEGNGAEIGLAFADAYKMLAKRIGIFISLPHGSLDRMALQTRVDEIGRAER
jgi:arsenate reductase (thioredoxin)